MTSFTVKKHVSPAVSSSRSSRSSMTAFRILNRKRPQTNVPDTVIDEISNISSSEIKSHVLSSLRHNYVSRGLHVHPLADKTSRCGCIDSRNTSPIPSTIINPERHPLEGHFRIDDARRSVSLLKFATLQREESEMDDETEDETLSCDKSISSSESREDRKSYTIKFQCYVKVVEIPNRHSYSTKQKKCIWNDSNTIRTNAKRNRIESDWEGIDWKNAPEEQDFCTLQNGIKVHPVYFPYAI